MGRDLERSLDRCLDSLREGRSVEQCLLLFPEVADDLEALLLVAAELNRLPRPEPRPEAVRTALLRAGGALPSRGDSRWRDRGRPLSGRQWLPVRKAAFGWAAAAAAVLVVTLGVGTASARSVPGDLLYSLKLATERVAFALTTGPERRAELRLSFADRRLGELVRTAQDDGRIDPTLLERLLEEATLALEDATPATDERYRDLLVRADAFNAYQRRVFERLRPTLPPDDSQLLSRAISVCDAREQWMRRTWDRSEEPHTEEPGSPTQRRPTERDRCWDSDCRWK